MSRSLIPFTLILFAAALLAVPAALAKGGHRGTVIRGTCTQQSTSKLKVSRDNRRIEVEFQVDQNQNGVPWKVTLRRNGARVASFTATTHAPSGSFEVRRLIANGPGADRISARATRASGEVCSASGTAPKAAASSTKQDDGPAHDAGDDHGHDAGPDF